MADAEREFWRVLIFDDDDEEVYLLTRRDLQEPLRKIEVLSGMLLDEAANLSQAMLEQLVRLQKSAERMRDMIDGLLQLSRLSTEARPFQAVDLRQRVQEVLSDLEMQIMRTGNVYHIAAGGVTSPPPTPLP